MNAQNGAGSDPVQQDIIDEFSLFPEWLDRYQYLIDLGRKLEPLDESEKTDDALLEGCQSKVWFHIDGDAEALRIRANSDAAIVSGLIALVLRVYSGRSAREILDLQPYFIEAIGLRDHLSPTRSNGLAALLNEVRAAAAVELAAAS
jgi:cysteine desulfuration protein SufE